MAVGARPRSSLFMLLFILVIVILYLDGRAIVAHADSTPEAGSSVELSKVLQVRLPSGSILVWISVDEDGIVYALYVDDDNRVKLTVVKGGEGGYTLSVPSPEDARIVEPLRVGLDDRPKVYLRARLGAAETLYIYSLEGSRPVVEASIELGVGYLIYDVVPTPLGLAIGGSKATPQGRWIPFIAIYSYDGEREALWLLDDAEGKVVSLGYTHPSYVCGLALIDAEGEGTYRYLCVDAAVESEKSEGSLGPAEAVLGSYMVAGVSESCMVIMGPKVLLVGGIDMEVIDEYDPQVRPLASSYGGGLAVFAGSFQGSLALEVIGVDSDTCSLGWRALIETSTPQPPVAYIGVSPSGRYLAIAYYSGAAWSLAVYKVSIESSEGEREGVQGSSAGVTKILEALGTPMITLALLALLAVMAAAALLLKGKGRSLH